MKIIFLIVLIFIAMSTLKRSVIGTICVGIGVLLLTSSLIIGIIFILFGIVRIANGNEK